MLDSLYTKNRTIGRLYLFFSSCFVSCTRPMAESLFLLVLAIIALESADSIRFLHRHFLRKVTEKSLNAFYYACSHSKADPAQFMPVLIAIAMLAVPKEARDFPVFLCVDDTMVEKYGTKFEHVSKLFDHAAHNGTNYLNGHCFVSLMLCVPIWNGDSIGYLGIPLSYRMWEKKMTKLAMACEMVMDAMKSLADVRHVVILCDSRYAKKDIFALTTAYDNLGIICNARKDTALYDLPPAPTGKRGRPRSKGRRLSPEADLTFTVRKLKGWHVGHRKVLTNLLKGVPVDAYVTTGNDGACRVFLSTVTAMEIPWAEAYFRQEGHALHGFGSGYSVFLPMACYSLRWNIETGYYEQKEFWSLCRYMVRGSAGIGMLVNLISLAYAGVKLLPYTDHAFEEFRGMGVQEFRFVLSQRIHEQIFLMDFLKTIENTKKSKRSVSHLKQWVLEWLLAA